ncbi:hypothetical protein PCL_09791 [Purpureocillium lilacinum]|uniref:Uncharacterized protein n=2 Tax=Purpureocillium lilacinum TaxID=33203 RepID=A0ACC4DTE3_PURLI|nr:hypothetical protein PCL_09791 [Purpureocillium lilacinum]
MSVPNSGSQDMGNTRSGFHWILGCDSPVIDNASVPSKEGIDHDGQRLKTSFSENINGEIKNPLQGIPREALLDSQRRHTTRR